MRKKGKLVDKGRRCLQVGDQIREEISRVVRLYLNDPRVMPLTITDVILAPDFLSAKVFFVPFGCSIDLERRTQVSAALNSASGFIRSHLYQVLRIKNVPALTFIYDDLFDRAAHISSLIDRAIASS
ncbi:30S ribosome-binding factor RbfA [Candidatus Ichthyocystis hellenicum]|uniref:30S ribosome-binding factor RbfA n=1 Tax=Candidatus Ichthyocystis hellenicum TaxID=1561003 RepID=UPI000B830DAC|nr:30S ribosome-binding factor RbfA [Candidatus Ichthyocystis hellenicum]